MLPNPNALLPRFYARGLYASPVVYKFTPGTTGEGGKKRGKIGTVRASPNFSLQQCFRYSALIQLSRQALDCPNQSSHHAFKHYLQSPSRTLRPHSCSETSQALHGLPWATVCLWDYPVRLFSAGALASKIYVVPSSPASYDKDIARALWEEAASALKIPAEVQA